MAVAVSPVTPDAESVATAAHALDRVQADLRSHSDGPATVRLLDDDADQFTVPRAAVELLARVLAHGTTRGGGRVDGSHAGRAP